MHKQLKQAIELSRKTGDRLIVYDMSQDDSAFVVMNLDEYEKLALKKETVSNLTEGELLDKINRDIATWKSEQSDSKTYGRTQEKQFDLTDDYHQKLEENYQLIEEELDSAKLSSEKEEVKKSSQWKIPSERKENAEEVIEEDRQYLEEV